VFEEVVNKIREKRDEEVIKLVYRELNSYYRFLVTLLLGVLSIHIALLNVISAPEVIAILTTTITVIRNTVD